MFCLKEWTDEGADDCKTTADYSFTRKIYGGKMTGRCKLLMICHYKSGRVSQTSDEILWIAERK